MGAIDDLDRGVSAIDDLDRGVGTGMMIWTEQTIR